MEVDLVHQSTRHQSTSHPVKLVPVSLQRVKQAPAILTPDLGNETTCLPLGDIGQDQIIDLFVLDIKDIIPVVSLALRLDLDLNPLRIALIGQIHQIERGVIRGNSLIDIDLFLAIDILRDMTLFCFLSQKA